MEPSSGTAADTRDKLSSPVMGITKKYSTFYKQMSQAMEDDVGHCKLRSPVMGITKIKHLQSNESGDGGSRSDLNYNRQQ